MKCFGPTQRKSKAFTNFKQRLEERHMTCSPPKDSRSRKARHAADGISDSRRGSADTPIADGALPGCVTDS